MDGKQLKNSILQWAIQGKLVPQNPKDEPAQKLLEKIALSRHSERSEESSKGSKKTSLRGAKATKQSKALSSRIYRENGVWYEQVGTATPKDISDEIPFEIPESWAWCRFNSICDIARGGSPRPIQDYLTDSPEGYNWIKIGDTEKGGKYINSTKERIKPEGLTKTRLIHKGDFLLTNSMSFGRPYISNINGCIHDGWLVMSILGNAFVPDYLYYLLSSPYAFHQFCGRVAGAVVKNLNIDKVAESLIPLPPLAEQKRIVAKLEQVLPLAEEYGAAQEQLDKLNKELPEALKKSILQEAIQGKLVPQNPKDEPASVLLAKIRKEKESLVKQGKLKKKDLEITPIDDDEIPFEIPDSWTWCRLGDIVSKLVDGDHNPPSGIAKKTEYMMLSSRNINFDKLVDLDNVRYLDADVFAKENERTNATIGDVLFTSVGTIGRSCVLKENVNICFQRSVTIMTTYVYNEYLKRYFDSPFYQNYADEHAVGTAQRGFYLKEMEQSLIALPPLAEQKRIVAKLEQLFKVL